MSSYSRVINKYDDKRFNAERKKEKLQQIEEAKEVINVLTVYPWEEDLTAEQVFLIKYFGLNLEDFYGKKFNASNFDKVLQGETELTRDELEKQRYEAMVDLLALTTNSQIRNANQKRDCFHEEIKDWDDFTKTLSDDTLITKKLRNLQFTNILAHKFSGIFDGIITKKVSRFDRKYPASEKLRIKNECKSLFSPFEEEKVVARKRLKHLIKYDKAVHEIESDETLRNCMDMCRFMYEQKMEYFKEVLSDLSQTKGEYNYGKKTVETRDKSQYICLFDVPGYGQFSMLVNPRDKTYEEIVKNIQEYNGEKVATVNLLYKADENLIKQAQYEKLTNSDKQIYRIVSQKVKEEGFKGDEGVKNLERIKEEREKLRLRMQENEQRMKASSDERGEIIQGIKEGAQIVSEQKSKQKKVQILINHYNRNGEKNQIVNPGDSTNVVR